MAGAKTGDVGERGRLCASRFAQVLSSAEPRGGLHVWVISGAPAFPNVWIWRTKALGSLAEGLFLGRIRADDTDMKKLLVLLAAALVLAGCYSGPVDTDTYNRNHEPKTGGSDL